MICCSSNSGDVFMEIKSAVCLSPGTCACVANSVAATGFCSFLDSRAGGRAQWRVAT
eukprot:UN14660